VDSQRSPTVRLLAGLLVTLTAVAVYSGYTIAQMRALRELQAETIDRNRTDSLLLLRIQNGLSSLGLGMRDMLDANEPYPLTAWKPQFSRIRTDLDDAMSREAKYSPVERSANQRQYLATSFEEFWRALDRVFSLASSNHEAEARAQVQLSLQARQAALTTAVARFLVQNNENEQQMGTRTRELYAGVERNVYIFMTAMLALIAFTSLYLVQGNRKLFRQVAELSQRRGELAQQLISMQENTFRSISRELHDEFGQILTAIGAMLRRAHRQASGEQSPLLEQLTEAREIVQITLEKVRSLSHALHPVVLDEAGLESAIDVYLPSFERQTGITVHYQKQGEGRDLDRGLSIHLYRVMQEALNNVARHSGAKAASVRLHFREQDVVLEIADDGVGFRQTKKHGLGLISMRERVGLVNGRIEFLAKESGGALVRVTAPIASTSPAIGAHAGI